MRLVTFEYDTRRRIGAVDDDRVVDLEGAYARSLADVEGDSRAAEIASVRIPSDMTAFIAGLEPSRRAAERALEHGDPAYPLEDVRLLAPLVPPIILNSGQNFDTCAPLGPWIVTRDEIPDPHDLGLRTYVNGELRQSNSSAKMIWDVATIVSFFSDSYTLQPGVLIETGTPGGTAWATDPEIGGRPYERADVMRAGYLQPGDVVTVEIDGIGALTNPTVLAPAREPAAADEASVLREGG